MCVVWAWFWSRPGAFCPFQNSPQKLYLISYTERGENNCHWHYKMTSRVLMEWSRPLHMTLFTHYILESKRLTKVGRAHPLCNYNKILRHSLWFQISKSKEMGESTYIIMYHTLCMYVGRWNESLGEHRAGAHSFFLVWNFFWSTEKTRTSQ